MRPHVARLGVFDRVSFQRAEETFPEQQGTMDIDNTMYLLSILEVSSEVECSVILNAVNLSHSWVLLGQVLSQQVMNRALLGAFRHPRLIPNVAELAATCDGRGWIFHAVLKIVRRDPDLFRASILGDHPIWHDFLLGEFADDFYDKSVYVDAPYDQRPFVFLMECILFGWPAAGAANVEVGRDLVPAFVEFCIAAGTPAANELMSYLAPVFPERVFPIVGNGFADRLNGQSLAFFYVWEGADKPERLRGNPAIMAEKLLARLPKQAKALIAEIPPDDPELETVRAMLSHFNSRTKRFVVD